MTCRSGMWKRALGVGCPDRDPPEDPAPTCDELLDEILTFERDHGACAVGTDCEACEGWPVGAEHTDGQGQLCLCETHGPTCPPP